MSAMASPSQSLDAEILDLVGDLQRGIAAQKEAMRRLLHAAPEDSELSGDLSELWVEFCGLLGEANRAAALSAALRMTGQVPHTRQEPVHHYHDGKCAAANDRD